MKTGWKWSMPAVLMVGAAALAACGSSSSSSSSSSGGGGAAPASNTLVVSSDLPLQGASADASADTNNAIKLLLEQAGNKAGKFTIQFKPYDNSTAAKGGWDDATCAANAQAHVSNKNEVAVMGTYNSGCAKIEVPVLNQAPGGGMLMVSHANTNPGLTKAWDPGEPDKYYPSGSRNYGRIVATDDFQGTADAQFAAQDLKVKRCYVLNDAQTYGVGVAKAFVDQAKKVGITVLANDAWDAKQPNYTALMNKIKGQNPDCVYLGGIEDNNGGQLVKDKVKVLGPNTGAVKLVAPDGFTGYPSLQKEPEAQGMYLSFAGLPTDVLGKQGGEAAKFQADFKAKYGHAPASNYSVYGAAAMQIILAAIAKSDGTRGDVVKQVFTAPGITIPVAQSVIGKEFGVDPQTGDTTVRDMAIEIMKNNQENFLKPWPVK
jgi:branched-chain amino acid transport system substrate-binding protein